MIHYENSYITLTRTKLFFIALACALILLFIYLQPHLSSKVLVSRRVSLWSNFLSETRDANTIDGRTFWEFREFYYPGHLVYKRNGFDTKYRDESIKAIDIPLNMDSINLVFLRKDTRQITSIDGLVSTDQLASILPLDAIDTKEIIFKNTTSVVYKEDKDQIKIVFILPVDEMKKANGLFNYDQEADLFKGKYWISITKLHIM